MKNKIFLLVLTLSLMFVPSVFAREYEELVPYVNDFTNTLTQTEYSELNQKCAEIETKSTVEIAVVIVENTGDETALEYARILGDLSGVGKRGLDNGIVVLWSIESQRGAIATAKGTMYKVTDSQVNVIGSSNRVYFDRGDVYLGLLNIVNDIGKILIKTENPTSTTTSKAVPVSSNNVGDAVDSTMKASNFVAKGIVFAGMLGLILYIPLKFVNGSSTSYNYDVEEETTEEKGKEAKLPKELPDEFVAKYNLRKDKNGKYFKEVKVKNTTTYVERECSTNWLLWYWVLFHNSHYRYGGKWHHNSEKKSVKRESRTVSRSNDSNDDDDNNSSFSIPSSFGGGGGFSGGGGGGF